MIPAGSLIPVFFLFVNHRRDFGWWRSGCCPFMFAGPSRVSVGCFPPARLNLVSIPRRLLVVQVESLHHIRCFVGGQKQSIVPSCKTVPSSCVCFPSAQLSTQLSRSPRT